ncbi:ribosome small subunit-dependent GTPase A [Thermaerobacter marianensis DSM 12885]|uniref:Small ribosomal subunit biogenesis GTPase RsgA n=1 Tax=Thermaerobacter marianensis (strain ATCC 700841 / DSM 12885 / JCM 10246 / 7p75a) TaxID=644966 RepID=E6SJB0_THEM7|nr:ribosome small subunit-dependent GTPase A [Thermaerobacter marianensis]ADU51038.1 ribosome small subunit-dependent GTPase A [Thermaerobacter marianensis DSM 12885]
MPARTGTVVKAQTNLYEVRLDDTGEVLLCALRGRLRRQAGDVLTGDRVEVVLQPGGAAIERVLPRRNRLVRPPIANVDRVLLIQSLADPDPVPILMDRVLVQAEALELPVVLCFTKLDLVVKSPDDPLPEPSARLVDGYRRAGYPVHLVAAPRGWGLDALAAALKEGATVLAGPSGAGKSTLLNALQPGLQLATGEVSRKLGRGRHTTRHVALLPLAEGGWVADTPGFSRVDLPDLEPEELGDLWPEIRREAPDCRFRGCLHRSEPGCAVRAARDAGRIAAWRYQNYLVLLGELEERLAERYK